VLKPQDIVVLLKLAVTADKWSYAEMAHALGMSASEVHSAIARTLASGLLNPSTLRPNRQALLEFLVHGVRYVFPAKHGGVTRGLPTGSAAPPLKDRFVGGEDLPPVWPDPLGDVRGEDFRPLDRSVAAAARKDPALYELLALVDALRGGRARERGLAVEELRSRLS
jgi:hypothetical protein